MHAKGGTKEVFEFSYAPSQLYRILRPRLSASGVMPPYLRWLAP